VAPTFVKIVYTPALHIIPLRICFSKFCPPYSFRSEHQATSRKTQLIFLITVQSSDTPETKNTRVVEWIERLEGVECWYLVAGFENIGLPTSWANCAFECGL